MCPPDEDRAEDARLLKLQAGPGGVKTRSFEEDARREAAEIDDSTTAGIFAIIHYNVHSLMCFEERTERIFMELGNQHWDVLVFSETWREEQSEAWTIPEGHTWFGSGGSKGQRGVGFLLHQR